MFDVLLPSGQATGTDGSWPARAASVAAHALIVAAAVQLTGRDPPPRRVDRDTVPALYLPAAPARAVVGSRGTPVLHLRPRLVVPAVFPLTVPTLAPVPGPVPGFNAGGSPAPIIAAGWGPVWGPESAPGVLMDWRAVEEQPELIFHPAPRYPELARQAGLEGRVLVEAILDTLGAAEAGSLRVLSAPHALFSDAARSVVLGSRYRPGRVAGRPVRVRVVIPVVFRLRR